MASEAKKWKMTWQHCVQDNTDLPAQEVIKDLGNGACRGDDIVKFALQIEMLRRKSNGPAVEFLFLCQEDCYHYQ